jgi:hypothetical protein
MPVLEFEEYGGVAAGGDHPPALRLRRETKLLQALGVAGEQQAIFAVQNEVGGAHIVHDCRGPRKVP